MEAPKVPDVNVFLRGPCTPPQEPDAVRDALTAPRGGLPEFAANPEVLDGRRR